jgi:hypothetical protein
VLQAAWQKATTGIEPVHSANDGVEPNFGASGAAGAADETETRAVKTAEGSLG